jgi:CheY-like chemotaxis protein
VTRKLLLADDSVTIQRVVELTFSGEDIEVVTVSDGEEAIARLIADPPDIVLADIAMPKKNGYDVAAFVKEHPTLANVPVLLLAGAFEPVDEDRARQVKCDGVLVKPFETHEVIARVRELIDGQRRPPESPGLAAPPAIPEPVAPAKLERPDESLDEYFDRLDVAFAARAQGPPRPFPHLTPPMLEPQPEPPAAVAAAEPVPEAEVDHESRNVIADLFQLFLEVEQGEREASSVNIPEEIARLRRRNRIE